MKAQRFFFAALVLFCTAVFSYATVPPPETGNMIVHLSMDGTHSIDLHIANLQQNRTGVFLTNFDGKVWYSDYIWNENGYAVNLNLEGMPEGEYLLFVKNRYDEFARAVSVRERGVVIFEESRYRRDQPEAIFASDPTRFEGSLITYFYAPGDNRIGVQLANLRDEKLEVRLNTLSGIVAFTETVEGVPAYAKSFNLSGMDTGSYYLVIRTEEMVQIQFFTIHKTGVELEGRQVLDMRKVHAAFAAW